MKKNKLTAIIIMGVVALTGLTVFARQAVTEKILCPNCNTEIEVERKAAFLDGRRGEMTFPKTTEELKAELAAKVSSGEMTQEQMDKKIAQYEQMQKKIEERKAEQEKKLEAYKTELSAKVSAGEITQEEMDKKIEQYGKKVPGKNFGRRLGRGQKNYNVGKRNMKVNEKINEN